MSRHHGNGKLRRATCPLCKREVAVYAPTTGNGSVDIFRAHRTSPGGPECDGWAARVPTDAYVGEAAES